jgi:bifunctional diaminopimelate decarboxylase / aspartate kinase
VLLARVTQLKRKGQYHYLGVSTGMNSLIRPALYGAYHEIVNLSRLRNTADTQLPGGRPDLRVGRRARRKPATAGKPRGRHDILVANAGAYGRVMSSRYNRRRPPRRSSWTTSSALAARVPPA